MPHPEANTRKTTTPGPARTATPQPTPGTGTPEVSRPRTRSTVDTSLRARQALKYKEARNFLDKNGLLSDSTPYTLQSLASVLLLLAKYKVPGVVVHALEFLAETIQSIEVQCLQCVRMKDLPELLSDLRTEINADFSKRLETLELAAKTPSPKQEQISKAAKEIGQAAETIKSSLTEMGSSIEKVTATNSQLENTATTYRDALIGSKTQQPQRLLARLPLVDPKVAREVERKARQILIDTSDEKTMGANLAEIKDKVSAAIVAIADPAAPKDTTVLEVSKPRNGGITILFKEKEVVEWLRDTAIEMAFTLAFAPGALIRQRLYSILIPRIPLTFDPADDSHLWEIEENNNMPGKFIQKARWIKPINRRSPEQRAAHAIFTLNNINITNTCIRDGLYVCGLKIHPNHLKHEPMQCMKCRHWGHFAHNCLANEDTCGTCRESRRTNQCSNKGKLHCVSCKTDTHASWDRECPEFLRRSTQLDENFPENNLPYFPTSEEWMLIPRPSRIPLQERFPPRYAPMQTTQTNQPNRNPRTTAPRNISRQPRCAAPRTSANQSTLHQYLGPRGHMGNHAPNANSINSRFADADFNPNHNHPNFYQEGEQFNMDGWN